ncbi:MAG TPA: chemotaxis protein CheX [Humisphaera sp.]
MSTASIAPPSAAAAAPAGEAPLNRQIVVAFVESIRSVYATMLGTQVQALTPYLKPDIGGPHDVSGVIGFSGGFHGSVTVGFPRDVAEKSVAAFAGTALPMGTADFADAVGELTNMVAGAAKSTLNGGASISTPVVVVGTAHTMPRLKDVPSIVIPCRCKFGDFSVEVNMKQQHGHRG